MKKADVRCVNCCFIFEEEDLEKVVEFKLTSESEIERLTTKDFYKKYKDLDDVFSAIIINACPYCLSDEYLQDPEYFIESALEHNGVEVYRIYENYTELDKTVEYRFSLDICDLDGFDIRDIETYNDNLSIEENLKLAIDKGLLEEYTA